MFRATRWLLAAKTAVKEPTKVRQAASKKEDKVKKVIDTTKFFHSKWEGNSLPDLIDALPRPAKPNFADHATWLHKWGFGLKFYRPKWSRYPEPCYWTVAKYKPRGKKGHPRVWGFRTWRGATEPIPRRVPGINKLDWRILMEPGTRLGPSQDDYWEAPAIDANSQPKDSTQIPEGLKGCAPGTWPYPWGKEGTVRRLGFKGKLAVREAIKLQQQTKEQAEKQQQQEQQEAPKDSEEKPAEAQ